MSEEKRTEDLNGILDKWIALCPLDGRYDSIKQKVGPYLGEYGLQKYRVQVEVEWLLFLMRRLDDNDLPKTVTKPTASQMMQIEEIAEFGPSSMKRIKELEAITRHDVKSVEKYVAENVEKIGCPSIVSYVHIGCTSEDITNLAYALAFRDVMTEVWMPAARNYIELAKSLARQFKKVPMPAHTHGQEASPTVVGKEFAVFVARLERILEKIEQVDYLGKFNGATGNYSAISVAFPRHDWTVENGYFVATLGLSYNDYTTQIEPHDWLVDALNLIAHFNRIIVDCNQDMRTYTSYGYFKGKVIADEVGSSTMPQKVNPIDFENGQRNLEIGAGICDIMSRLLPISWMQRDLMDSTLFRNLGMAVGYSLQGIESSIKGFKRADINTAALDAGLEGHYEVLAEPAQTMLRKYGDPTAYDRLKAISRGKQLTREDLHDFINSLDISDEDRQTLLELEPRTYIGYASELANSI